MFFEIPLSPLGPRPSRLGQRSTERGLGCDLRPGINWDEHYEFTEKFFFNKIEIFACPLTDEGIRRRARVAIVSLEDLKHKSARQSSQMCFTKNKNKMSPCIGNRRLTGAPQGRWEGRGRRGEGEGPNAAAAAVIWESTVKSNVCKCWTKTRLFLFSSTPASGAPGGRRWRRGDLIGYNYFKKDKKLFCKFNYWEQPVQQISLFLNGKQCVLLKKKITCLGLRIISLMSSSTCPVLASEGSAAAAAAATAGCCCCCCCCCCCGAVLRSRR